VIVRIVVRLCLLLFSFLSFESYCIAQDTGKTTVSVLNKAGHKITQLEIELQNPPNNMEPVTEPRRIRIDDRSNVQFFLKNLSPLDVCSRSSGTPTPTAETPVAESFAATIAKLGGIGIGGALDSNSKLSANLQIENHVEVEGFDKDHKVVKGCNLVEDSEYKILLHVSERFFRLANDLVGTTSKGGKCRGDHKDQIELACEIDLASREMAEYAGADYRGKHQSNFDVEGSALQEVRDAYSVPLESIVYAGRLQAMVDEMTAWALDLHKKYDYSASTSISDLSVSAAPPTIPGVLTVSPTKLSFVSGGSVTQIVQLAAAGKTRTFVATPSTGWLQLSKAGSSPSNNMLKDAVPEADT